MCERCFKLYIAIALAVVVASGFGMFYLFNVNEGCAQQLEVSAALGTVRNLQQVIEEITKVPVHEQVLLINGGEGLHPDRSVSCYQGCGTESNPVFLFYKFADYKQRDFGQDECADILKICQEINRKLKVYEDASVSTALITRYIESSRSAYQVASNAYEFCSRIFQEHQFLYQGWLALMSNFDECRSQIQRRVEKFFSHHEKMKVMKTKAQAVVHDFDNVLELMEKIRIPETLLARIPGLETGKKLDGQCTLYDFVAAADPKNSLHEVVDGVLKSIDQMDDSACSEVKMHQEAMQSKFGKSGWQEIGGINGRFQHLDKELRNLEQRTTQMKQVSSFIFQAGHSLGCAVKDIVIKQRAQIIEVMKILDFVHDTLKAFMGSKQEILHNIRERLSKLALKAYDRLHMLNNAVTVYEEKYMGLRNRLDIVRQVKEAPIVYIIAVAETVRRSALQQEFMLWFAKFMEKSQKVVHEEVSLRDAFAAKLEHHFLKQIFSGLFDSFPAFAPTEMPTFDQDLPPIDVEYISFLKQTLPTYAHLLKVDKPCIYSRLAVCEQPICSTVSSSALLAKDEQVLPPESSASERFSKNFPSTNWLSGDENTDLSPSNAVFFVKTPSPHFGSSLELESNESPSKTLNSLPPSELLFSPKEPPISKSITVMENLPVKIASQDDLSVERYEFRNVQRIIPKDFATHAKTALKNVKSLSESAHQLQELFGELGNTFDGFVKKVFVGFTELPSNTAGTSCSDFENARKDVAAEDLTIGPRDLIGKEISSNFERKMEEEIKKVKEQVEIDCKLRYENALEAEVKAKVSEAERIFRDKVKQELLSEFSKFENEIKNNESKDECAELLLERADEDPTILSEEKSVEELEVKEPLVNSETKDPVDTAATTEQSEVDEMFPLTSSSFLCDSEFQEEFRRCKLKIAKAYFEWHKKAVLKVEQETEKIVEKKWSDKYDSILKNEIEQQAEILKSECAAKYAIKLKEEQERLKEETEKACVLQYKQRFEEDLAKEKEKMEVSLKAEYAEKLRVEVEAARSETKQCSDEYERRLQEKISEIEKEVEERLLERCKQDLEIKAKAIEDEANRKIVLLEEESAQTIKGLQQQIEKLQDNQRQDEALIATLNEECSVMVKGEAEAMDRSDAVKENATKTELAIPVVEHKGEETGKLTGKNVEEMRAAMEREYTKKMNFLIKGYEEKKLQEIARIKSEARSELCLKDCRIHELEELTHSLGPVNAAQALLTSKSADASDAFYEGGSCALNVSYRKVEKYFDDARETDELQIKIKDQEETSGDDISALGITSRGAQTRLRVRDLNCMITVQDLHEFATVLVIFSEEHGAYTLFSVNPVLYFVKESCLRRLGLKSDHPMNEMKKDWIIAIITRMEFCQIRKVNNRYNLASGTRFYRVEVEPLLIESTLCRHGDE